MHKVASGKSLALACIPGAMKQPHETIFFVFAEDLAAEAAVSAPCTFHVSAVAA